MAQALAQGGQLTMPLDVDAIKHSLSRWDADTDASGRHARRLALALAGEHLEAGYDVVIGQYLVRTEFIEDLAALAERHRARFVELVLDIDETTLAKRLRSRAKAPSRPEHTANNRLVGPSDAGPLVASMQALRGRRPGAIWIDARGPRCSTLDLLRDALGA